MGKILPGTGRGTTRRVVERDSLLRCARLKSPSVSRFAAATAPQAGRI
jgi:hypothetical protein